MIEIENFDNMYRGNGTEKDFIVPFPYINTVDVQVYVRTVSTGVDVLKTEGVDYNISGDLCTFGTAPLSTEYVFFLRKTSLTQATIFDGDSNFEEEDYESALDKIVQQYQEIQKEITRLSMWLKNHTSVKYMAHAEADKMLGWDESENLCNYPLLEATATIASQAEAEAGSDNTKLMTSLRSRQGMKASADSFAFNVSAPSDATVYLGTSDADKSLILPSNAGVDVKMPDIPPDAVKGKDFYINPTAAGTNIGRIESAGSGDTLDQSTTGNLGLFVRGDFAHLVHSGTFSSGTNNWSIVGYRESKKLGGTTTSHTWSGTAGLTANYWRDGNNLVSYGYISVTGATASVLEVTIPYSLDILPGWHSSDPWSIPVGELCFWDNSTSTLEFGTIYIKSTSTDTLKFYQNLRLGGDTISTQQTLFTAANNDIVWYYFEVPISTFYTGV